MVDQDVAARKIANASARLAAVDRMLAQPREAFVADLKGRDLTAFYVQLAIQECIDLASHWVADSDWQPPDDAGAAFDVLADHDMISRDLATTMREAVGLRNRIAHGYATVDHGRLYDEVSQGTGAIKQFLAALADAAGL